MRRHHTDFRGKGQPPAAAAARISAVRREWESWRSLNRRFAPINAVQSQFVVPRKPTFCRQ
jgi:hypothetical protein